MKFADWAPFGDVIKHVKSATTDQDFPSGIPIYVDPKGLAEADKTLDSQVTIDLEGVPLGKSLKLVVSQLDLTYAVRHGMVIITGRNIAASRDDGMVLSFRRVGHCYFALLAAFLGGMVGRWVHRHSRPEFLTSDVSSTAAP
jgi:hypothetical protein